MSLLARHLEAEGFPTVILGAAKDIVETVGVPRFAFSDVPLGNPCGRPFDRVSQQLALEGALRLLESATGARTTWQNPIRWSEDGSHDWKLDFNHPDSLSAEQRDEARQRFEEQKSLARRAAEPTGGTDPARGPHGQPE